MKKSIYKKLVRLDSGEPDFPTPRHIVGAAITSLRKGETHYGDAEGSEALREAIRRAVKKELGFLPSARQILAAPSPSLIYFLLQSTTKKGDEIIVPEPGFARYYALFRLLGLKPVPVALKEREGFRLNPRRVRSALTKKTKLIILNSPHNPTGSVMTKKDVEAIASLAQQHDLIILSDEVYSKLLYRGVHYSPGVKDRCRERTVILNSFSKAYAMTGWRLGYVIGPEPIIDAMRVLVQNTIFSIPLFIQRAGIRALTGTQKPLTLMAKEYKKRRDYLVRELNMLPGVSCLMPEGALYTFPNITKTGMTSDEFIRLMEREAGVALRSGTEYGEAGEGHVRIPFCVSEKDLQEGVRRMARILKKHGQKN